MLYLSLIAGYALLTRAALEAVRTRVMVALSTWLDRRLGGSVLEGSIGASAASGRTPSIQGLRDLAALRVFLTGPGMFPILDAPWTPIFIAVIFMMHPNLEAQVRLTAFSMRNAKPLKGRVTSVSADRLIDARTGQAYYLARIELTEDPTKAFEGAILYPGMPAEVIIVVGARSTLGYIFAPILSSLNRAFREQ